MDTIDKVREADQASADPKMETMTRPAKMTHYRWVVIALCFIIIVINYMDRSAISYAIEPLKAEFGLTNEIFGRISAAFGIGYTLMTLGGGIIVDLWGARKVWAGSAIAWSICTALLGAANGITMLFSIRVLLGLTEGPCFPAMTRAITDWLPLSERARSSAISLAAVPLASAIGAPLISNLIDLVGWKTMFVVLGSLGIVWSVFWWILFRDYPQNSPHVSQQELEHIHEGRQLEKSGSDDELRRHHLAAGKTTWKFILLNPSLMSNNFAFFSFGYLLFFAVSWLPGFFEQTYHLKIKTVGLYLVAPWLTAAIMLMGAGMLCDYLWKKTGSMRISRTHMIWVSQLLSAICFLPVTLMQHLDLNQVILLVSLGVGFGLMPNAAFYSLNSDLAKDRAATSLGLMDCFLAAAGVLAPYLTGWLSQLTGDFRSAILLMVGLTFSSSLCVALFQHPDRDRSKAAG